MGAEAAKCQFCRIIGNTEASATVCSDADSVAFLDHRPLFPGHVLLVPRGHYATLVDLPDPLVGPLFRKARLLARAVRECLQAEGTFVAMNNRVSQSVPHFHIHIVPRNRGDGLRGFFWPRNDYRDSSHREDVRRRLEARIAALVIEFEQPPDAG